METTAKKLDLGTIYDMEVHKIEAVTVVPVSF